jgi:glycosyltransferase involved in cell wall biosynthesis
MNRFPGKLAVQQRVFPSYRAPFFERLASLCDGGMSLFSGLPRAKESIATTDKLHTAQYTLGRNIHLLDGSFYFYYQQGLLEWLERQNPTALIMEANPRCLSTSAAVRWMHTRARPVIGWGLGAPPLSGPLAGIRQRRRASLLRQFDAMIAYSRRGAEEYAALGFPRERIFVAHNAVSPPPSHPLPLRPPSFETRPLILFVGRLQARKRVDDLLRACARIGNVRLTIVGDGPERPRLQALAQQIFPSAEFAGAKHGTELKPFFEAADLFVLPGTGGLAVHEAMSYGLPVIVAQGDGTQDDLVTKENGWQIPPRDFEALVAAIQNALSDAARLRRMGAEAYRTVKESINIERMAETFVTALRSLT